MHEKYVFNSVSWHLFGIFYDQKTWEIIFFFFFSFTSGFVYYGVVLMTTQLMQQTPENGTSCDSGIANLP